MLQIPSPISEGCTSAAHGQLISTIFSDASVSRVVKRYASMWSDWTGVVRGTGKWRRGVSQSGEQLGRWKVCGRIWGVTGRELRPLVPPQMQIRRLSICYLPCIFDQEQRYLTGRRAI